MSTTCSFSGAVVTILAIFVCTASQCRGQSDHPNLQIRQEKMANGGASGSITVVGVATIVTTSSYNFKCQRLDGADGSNLQWEYVGNPTRTLQTNRGNNGIYLTLSNVGESAVGLYRCKDNSTNEAEELLLTTDNPAVLPVKSNVSLLEDSSLHLAVYSSGDPIEMVLHRWTLNGVAIDIANISADGREATIPSVQFQGDVQYSCTTNLFVDGYTRKAYAHFFVTVYVPPVVIKSPANAAIDEHSNVTLECRATGNPPPMINWTRNGVTVGDEEGIVNRQESNGSTSLPVVRSTYTLTGVQYEDRGAYRCIASIPTEELGLEQAELTSTSQEATLVVHAKLLLERRVGDQKEQLTENVIFITEMGSEVVVTCFGSGTLEWVGPSGAALPRSSNNTVHQEYDAIVDSQVLTISSFTLNFSGNYTCKSSVPNLEKSILITMDNPAVFPVEPVVYAPRDTTATLMVTVSSNPRPTEDNVVWYYRGSRIVPGQRHSFASTNQKLTIDDVEMGDYGEYTCEVNTTAGSDSATIILREPSLPTVKVLPSSPITTVLDQEVIANCTGSGSGQLEVTWTKEGTTGLPEGAIATPEGILMIASALEVHSGMYTCVVKNVAGSADVRLEVIVQVPPKVEVEIGRPRTNPPTLIQDGSTLVYSEGTEHKLLCSATGVPTPTLSWMHKGVTVGDNQVAGTNPLILSWDGPLSTNHSGTYTCRAKNEVATVTSTFILTVQPRTIPGSDVHVQLRILTKDCTKWSPEQLALARASVASTVYNNTLARCGCSFDIRQFSSHSLVCSYEVQDAVSFRAIIVSTSEVRASSIYAAFSSWARTGPTIVILGMEAKLDTSCDPLADSATSPECPVDDNSSSVFEPWVLAMIGTGAGCLILVVVAVVSSCCCYCCCCRKTGTYNSIYTKNIRRSFSFQAGPLQRESVEDAPGHDYVMDTITEADGRNHMYDQPENVRRESEAYRSSGGVILVGSSSENNSNTGGYSMLHPDDDEDQVASPTQQSQYYPPPIPHHGSFLSGVPASSFTQATTVSSVKASEAPLYAEVQDTDRKKSVQGCTPNAAPVSPNSNQGDGQTPIADMWYHQSVEDVLQGYSLSQPAYHASNEPLEYENPLPTWSQMDAASKTISNQQVRRAASQKHNGRMMPQLPPGLRTALV